MLSRKKRLFGLQLFVQAGLINPLAPIYCQSLTSGSPSPRRTGGMVYDSAARQLILFGGQQDQDRLLNDTWLWKPNRWTEVATAIRPPAAEPCALVYDSSRSRVVLLCDVHGGTWLWDSGNWRLTAPPFRFANGATTFDAARKQIVVFGGVAGASVPLDDTWIWDGRNWMQCYPASHPPAMGGAALAYDSARAVSVLLGENDTVTWLWNGSDWVRRSTVHSPPKRSRYALAYDEARSQVVLFGGEFPSKEYLGDTWIWDGTDWHEKSCTRTPQARSRHSMAYDAGMRQVLLFGGEAAPNGTLLNDTWAWDGENWTIEANNK